MVVMYDTLVALLACFVILHSSSQWSNNEQIYCGRRLCFSRTNKRGSACHRHEMVNRYRNHPPSIIFSCFVSLQLSYSIAVISPGRDRAVTSCNLSSPIAALSPSRACEHSGFGTLSLVGDRCVNESSYPFLQGLQVSHDDSSRICFVFGWDKQQTLH